MPDKGRDWVAVVLAVGLVIAVATITIAGLYDVILRPDDQLSENATLVLTTAFGGIIAILGTYVGHRAS
jgi:hypothetical protein